jgi:tetratricopeptide (TPR) repeat protein
MKNEKINIIGLLLLLSFAACNSPRREARRMVARAEALTDTLPDSTVLLIDSVSHMEVHFTERSRMEMALLQAEALFRNVSIDDDDIKEVLDHRIPIPDLERAASFFAGKKEYAQAAQAALYSGYVQQYYKEKAKAMQSYKEAERYGTLTNDHYIVSKAQYRMGKMLLDDGRLDESIGMLKKASLGFNDDQFIEKALSYNMMGVSNMLLTQYDSAEICLQKSMEYGAYTGSSSLKYKVLNNYSVLYLKKQQFGFAFDCLKKMSQDLEIDSSGLFMYYLNMGQLYMSIGSIDSSFHYFQKMEKIMPFADVRKETLLSSYSALIRAAKAISNDSLALQYREMHEDLLYDVMSQRQDQTVLRIKQQYDFDQLQNAIDMKTAQIKQMVAIGLILLFVILLFFLYRLAQRNKREAEINANLFHFMQQNEELKLRHEAYRKEEDAKSQQLADLLSEKFQMMQKLDYYLNNQGDKEPLRELEKELFDGKQHIKQFMEVFDMVYPGLQDTLKAKYPQMNDLDYKVCLLSRLKLSRSEEADLLGISTSVLDKIRGKVHRMMSEEKE